VIRARLDKEPAAVAAMFDEVAERYDLLNDVLSLGQDRWWRRMVARAVAARPGERVLDLAAGTGTSSKTFASAGAACVACDFSLGMLRAGARRMQDGRRRDSPQDGRRPDSPQAGPVRFVAGDALRLPFRDGCFDAVTISFGLRNVTDTNAALVEMLRVTRPGGRLVICEFGHMKQPWLDRVYLRYLDAALPTVARRLSRAGDAYEYLAESIRDWPGRKELAQRIAAAGWTSVRWRDLSFGAVTLHAARRPAEQG
jgi:demethylmenaquinone methyltransferase / 2-methoxy-6-polyprenyl-1,4-benzoquinol methylase